MVQDSHKDLDDEFDIEAEIERELEQETEMQTQRSADIRIPIHLQLQVTSESSSVACMEQKWTIITVPPGMRRPLFSQSSKCDFWGL